MNDKHSNKNKNCLNSISFAVIGVFIIIFESISLVMSILCVAIINWHFLKNFIKILNIISLVIIFLLIIINIFLFVNIKNIRYNIIKKYETRMCLSIFLIIIYLIIIIFNIYNSIYLSNKLKIADDPENGGKDQNYVDTHPNEFGDVPLKQFIIAGFGPSLISVLNVICIILCAIFRKKMILTYNKMLYEIDNRTSEANFHRSKTRNSTSSKNSKNSRNKSKTKRKSTRRSRFNSTEIRNSVNNANDKNDKEIKYNNNSIPNRVNSNNINTKINRLNEGEQNINKITIEETLNNKLDTNESLNNEQKRYTTTKVVPKLILND